MKRQIVTNYYEVAEKRGVFKRLENMFSELNIEISRKDLSKQISNLHKKYEDGDEDAANEIRHLMREIDRHLWKLDTLDYVSGNDAELLRSINDEIAMNFDLDSEESKEGSESIGFPVHLVKFNSN